MLMHKAVPCWYTQYLLDTPAGTRLLYEIPDQSEIIPGAHDDIMPGFLETDVTHLNYWGYECMLKEVGLPVLDYYRSVMAGN